MKSNSDMRAIGISRKPMPQNTSLATSPKFHSLNYQGKIFKNLQEKKETYKKSKIICGVVYYKFSTFIQFMNIFGVIRTLTFFAFDIDDLKSSEILFIFLPLILLLLLLLKVISKYLRSRGTENEAE